MCPGMEWTGDDPPLDYVCPSDVAPQGRARRMRSAISASAARARDHAQTMTPTVASAANDTAVSCGCVKAAWHLETRKKTLFGVIGELLAASGKMVKELANGVLDIAGDGLKKLMGPLTTIFTVVGVVVGVGVLVGITVAVLKARKKRKSI